ncbi:hypothetical protein ACWGET_18555 [Streptomyces zaomyceticus]|uniref:hypothetical protein n=1 Tax=Streptomyces zaomyceticus TaxID=68286 RepID=UPI002E1D3D3B
MRTHRFGPESAEGAARVRPGRPRVRAADGDPISEPPRGLRGSSRETASADRAVPGARAH